MPFDPDAFSKDKNQPKPQPAPQARKPFDPDEFIRTPAEAYKPAAPAATTKTTEHGAVPFDPKQFLTTNPPTRLTTTEPKEPQTYLEDAAQLTEKTMRGGVRGLAQIAMALPNLASREIHQMTGTKPGPPGFINRFADAPVEGAEEVGRIAGTILPFLWQPEAYVGRATLGGLANLATRLAPGAAFAAGLKFPEYWHLMGGIGLQPLANKAAPYIGQAVGRAGPFAEKLATGQTVRYLGRPEDAGDGETKK